LFSTTSSRERFTSQVAMRRCRRSTLATGLLLLMAAVGCGRAGGDAEGRSPPRADAEDRVLSYLRTFDLQETDEVVSVTPVVARDPRGGFLVVDAQESQLRRYGDDGRLLWHAGRKGRGPGEFTSPTGVARLASGQVVAGDRSGRLTFFDSAGGAVQRTVETRIRQLEDIVVLGDSALLLSGVPDGDFNGPRLHVWSLARDTVRASFFSPFAGARNRAAATVAGWTKAAVRGDTIAAVFAVSDTVYLFTVGGRALGRMPLNSSFFRTASEREPRKVITDPLERARWLSAFDYVADVHWLPDGGLLVPYQSIAPGGAMTRTWHLLGLGRGGERRFEVRGVSRVLEVDGRNGDIFLLDRNAEVPNRWALARLRR
jgi:hypothetical protein